jgi:FlaA1/EpsC-like NDP-sugar epimerase
VGGETYVMNMPSWYIDNLAKMLILHYGNKETIIEEIGIREGEKMHELLISEHESSRTKIFDKDYYVILPELKIDRDYSHLDNLEKVKFEKFSSMDNLKDDLFLEELLRKGEFLV